MPFIKNQMVKLLRIYFSDSMTIEGKNAAEYIMKESQKYGLAGVSIFHGVAGYGSHMVIHSLSLIHIAGNLPVIIEIIDTEDKLTEFINNIEDKIEHGLMTMEDMKIAFYKKCGK